MGACDEDFLWGEGAVGETGLATGLAAAASAFLGFTVRLLGVEPGVVVAPVAAFNRCCTAAITTRPYVSALRIHAIFLLRLGLKSMGEPPPLVDGRRSYNPSRTIKICVLWMRKCGDPKELA
jgi:hypothetical protein